MSDRGSHLKDQTPEHVTDMPDAATQISGLIFAMVLIDQTGAICEANQASESLLGRSAKNLRGRAFTDVIEMAEARVAARLADPEAALVARDLEVVVNDVEMRVNLTVSPLSGNPGWRVVTLSEITHEENMREETASGAPGAPSILAHEIKNPLSAIRGAAQLVARKLPHADKKLARMITDEVDRIARLIDRMQQLGSTQAEPLEPCNPHEAIRAAVATIRTAGSEPVTINEEFDPSLPPALASKDSLDQVLINLLSNARDAIAGQPNRSITIQTRFVSGLTLSAIRFGRSVHLPIEITVTDNGPGIEPSLRDHVFDPFVSTKKSGQGLGLALVRKLVRDMNGSISHERDRQLGLTHFRLHLPVVPKQAGAIGRNAP